MDECVSKAVAQNGHWTPGGGVGRVDREGGRIMTRKGREISPDDDDDWIASWSFLEWDTYNHWGLFALLLISTPRPVLSIFHMWHVAGFPGRFLRRLYYLFKNESAKPFPRTIFIPVSPLDNRIQRGAKDPTGGYWTGTAILVR